MKKKVVVTGMGLSTPGEQYGGLLEGHKGGKERHYLE